MSCPKNCPCVDHDRGEVPDESWPAEFGGGTCSAAGVSLSPPGELCAAGAGIPPQPAAQIGCWRPSNPGRDAWCSDFVPTWLALCPIFAKPSAHGPLCEFGQYGCEAEYWGTRHLWGGSVRTCSRCNTTKAPRESELDDPEDWCEYGDGGVYGMCGHRPYTTKELNGSYWHLRGDFLGPRPETDRVNVSPCDGATISAAAHDEARKLWDALRGGMTPKFTDAMKAFSLTTEEAARATSTLLRVGKMRMKGDTHSHKTILLSGSGVPMAAFGLDPEERKRWADMTETGRTPAGKPTTTNTPSMSRMQLLAPVAVLPDDAPEVWEAWAALKFNRGELVRIYWPESVTHDKLGIVVKQGPTSFWHVLLDGDQGPTSFRPGRVRFRKGPLQQDQTMEHKKIVITKLVEEKPLDPGHGFEVGDRVVCWSQRKFGTIDSIGESLVIALDGGTYYGGIKDASEIEHLAGRTRPSDELAKAIKQRDDYKAKVGRTEAARLGEAWAEERQGPAAFVPVKPVAESDYGRTGTWHTARLLAGRDTLTSTQTDKLAQLGDAYIALDNELANLKAKIAGEARPNANALSAGVQKRRAEAMEIATNVMDGGVFQREWAKKLAQAYVTDSVVLRSAEVVEDCGLFFEDPAKLDPKPTHDQEFVIAYRNDCAELRVAGGWYTDDISNCGWETHDAYMGEAHGNRVLAVARIPKTLTEAQLALAGVEVPEQVEKSVESSCGVGDCDGCGNCCAKNCTWCGDSCSMCGESECGGECEDDEDECIGCSEGCDECCEGCNSLKCGCSGPDDDPDDDGDEEDDK